MKQSQCAGYHVINILLNCYDKTIIKSFRGTVVWDFKHLLFPWIDPMNLWLIRQMFFVFAFQFMDILEIKSCSLPLSLPSSLPLFLVLSLPPSSAPPSIPLYSYPSLCLSHYESLCSISIPLSTIPLSFPLSLLPFLSWCKKLSRWWKV